jgi:hypothetical protein
MVTRNLLLALATWSCVLCADTEAQLFPHATQAKKVCCLSGRYDYSYNKLTNPVSSVTFPGILDTQSVQGAGAVGDIGRSRIRIKSYALRQRELANDHCRISKVVVTIDETGTWTVSLLAEQNPMLAVEQQRSRFQLADQNRFQITLRPLLGSTAVTPETLDNVDAATVNAIAVTSFWLEKGQQQRIHEEGHDPRLGDRFDSIRHVAVDLQYE